MKITKEQLRQVIKEELNQILSEFNSNSPVVKKVGTLSASHEDDEYARASLEFPHRYDDGLDRLIRGSEDPKEAEK